MDLVGGKWREGISPCIYVAGAENAAATRMRSVSFGQCLKLPAMHPPRAPSSTVCQRTTPTRRLTSMYLRTSEP